MRILYIGDVMGEVGIEVVEQIVPRLRREKNLDFVVAQAENVSLGKGITPIDFARLKRSGVDFFTGGNHSFAREAIYPALADPHQPIIRPANYPTTMPGRGYKYAQTPLGPVLVISMLGKVVGRDADKELANPLQCMDEILTAESDTPKVATIVNFHGDYSSEKVVIGHYVDGRVTMAVGDHWHVPTADARVLPGGTAHQTDVGMCGILNSSLGVRYDAITVRWRDGTPTRNVLETEGPRQFNALLVTSNTETGLAEHAEAIQIIL
ncbi:MAG TPA: TIGR00282 family metallophosphoesterase [Candidatus Saccharimonadales bacterium]|nr:TIGR00282 family metallophosphoesterase [Candidatus Saccharimonadales bacterium]